MGDLRTNRQPIRGTRVPAQSNLRPQGNPVVVTPSQAAAMNGADNHVVTHNSIKANVRRQINSQPY